MSDPYRGPGLGELQERIERSNKRVDHLNKRLNVLKTDCQMHKLIEEKCGEDEKEEKAITRLQWFVTVLFVIYGALVSSLLFTLHNHNDRIIELQERIEVLER